MSRLEQLYQEMILDHNKNPRNFVKISEFTHTAHGHNPLCGDDFTIYLKVIDGVIEDIGFEGSGCAISKSSGSLMTSSLKGKSVQDATVLKDKFLGLLIDNISAEDIGKLKVFEGVKKYPIRVKCATLVWRAFESALEGTESISTE